MHPAFWAWRHARRAFAKCGDFEGWPGCAPGAHSWEGRGEHGEGGFSGLGVRRPLRFLVHKLDLEEGQVTELARILNELKTERAQAEVDRQRTMGMFADALVGEAFDVTKAGEAGGQRVLTAERLRDSIINALKQIHAILKPDQRVRLAYLIRTGTLAL